ncbi:type VI secretion system ATPase TssH [Microbulbifer agarilyticus]|uniref:type VI secretion system ATPase TssH n=1 Tax=Microbulbifer agarilyticus TaxID=260552 RepID=UPI001C954086|nr:type VI secretion system ATPase TssH [Microbulbifer agarilyticus]MBY6210001.1 type VI secretion system ATPase TssH [Microbulbifer agarilyticus]
MINIDLKRLVETMTPHMRESLEGAAGICLAQNQYNVEIEHWLLKLLDNSDTDLFHLLEKHDINPSHFAKELARSIATFKAGSSRPPALSPGIVEAGKNCWMLASIDFGHRLVSSGHLLAALLLDETSRRQIFDSTPVLRTIAPESIRETARVMFGQTAESHHLMSSEASEGSAAAAVVASNAPALDKYTVNLTERARNGEIDPVLGRDEEIRQCVDILTRRRQNNPILTGEAGVGKTAVVEGFALRIANGDVPEPLRDVTVRTLDLGLLQAGASVKGEFENRLKSVIEEVRGSATPIILFIDEAHTMIGAGGKEGQGDAANLLKPALARGELRTIAATTWAEYKKYFERDPALTRRFQVVKVEEPDEEKAIDMMRGISPSLESHHRVRVLDEAIVASVKLSHRYIPGRQLPDKSVSLLDTACARVALSLSATPGPIEDVQRIIAGRTQTMVKLRRENAATGAHEDTLVTLQAEKEDAEIRLEKLRAQYQQETALIDQIRDLRDQIDELFRVTQNTESADITEGAGIKDKSQLVDLKQQLLGLNEELQQIQGDFPLMQPTVDEQAIAAVVANWTGIPVGKMVSDEILAVQGLAGLLNKRVIGQPHALEAVAQAIRTSRAGLTDPRKPVGVFLFCGTSGVGKTETALTLADTLFGGEQNITTINMSEFKEEHKVSMLLGSPPGYVGYGEGGVLTEAARRRPYSVILLDEMEKAHPGVQDIFYNLFDKGTIKDGEGRDIDFKNTVIIMTSNAGEDAIRAIFDQVEDKPEPEVLLDNIRPQLLKKFKPAFLGRTNIIAYYPLDDEDLVEICKINMHRISKRVREHYGAEFTYEPDVLINIVARCQEADTGARNIEIILNRSILPSLASECLNRMARGEEIQTVHIGAGEDGGFTYRLG